MCANRLFTQYHAQYPSYEQERILKEVVKSNSVICLLLLLSEWEWEWEWESTVLTFVELFTLVLQEPWRNTFKKQSGQADGNPADAIIYFNSYDISKSKKNMQDVMRTLVTSSECRRKTI